MALIDLQLNIKPAAWAVLHRLSECEPLYGAWHAATWAWYNGRERGIALTIERYISGPGQQRLVIVFGECRNSDEIFVDTWDGAEGDYMNGPQLEHLTDETYENRQQFKSIDKAAAYIFRLIEKRVGKHVVGKHV